MEKYNSRRDSSMFVLGAVLYELASDGKLIVMRCSWITTPCMEERRREYWTEPWYGTACLPKKKSVEYI